MGIRYRDYKCAPSTNISCLSSRSSFHRERMQGNRKFSKKANHSIPTKHTLYWSSHLHLLLLPPWLLVISFLLILCTALSNALFTGPFVKVERS